MCLVYVSYKICILKKRQILSVCTIARREGRNNYRQIAAWIKAIIKAGCGDLFLHAESLVRARAHGVQTIALLTNLAFSHNVISSRQFDSTFRGFYLRNLAAWMQSGEFQWLITHRMTCPAYPVSAAL